MKLGTDGVMNEWRQMQERIDALQKENAELRECMKEAIDHCIGCRYDDHTDKWRSVLEGEKAK